jgi:2OG-Fe(II) oxygenase superfamily
MSHTNPLLKQICQNPRAYVADGFISASEIADILDRYDAGCVVQDLDIAWDRGVAGTSGELPVAHDPLLGELAARIEAVLGFANQLPGATFRFRRYAQGDFHPAHVDCYQIAGHHLVATALLYLADALDGGETIFPDTSAGQVAITPHKGRLALWFNYTSDGAIDPRSRHRAEELRSGEKVTLAYFVYAPLACAAIEPSTARFRDAA